MLVFNLASSEFIYRFLLTLFVVVKVDLPGPVGPGVCLSGCEDYLCQQVLGFPPQSVRELPAPRRQVEDGRGRHVGRLHVVGVVEAALAAGAAGAASSSAPSSSSSSAASSPSTAQAAAAAGSVAAGRAAGRARRLTVALRCGDAHTRTADWLD